VTPTTVSRFLILQVSKEFDTALPTLKDETGRCEDVSGSGGNVTNAIKKSQPLISILHASSYLWCKERKRDAQHCFKSWNGISGPLH